ncbi:MAG TPA: ABC transporter ATP-binding protein [Pseudolabrys sp.]|nr:ABC transporter ATP-binding protein [Pseudolabrys sp.]
MHAQPRLALRNVECRYGETLAVADVNLELRAGEFVSLLGPSGCGKTTTLRMIAGFVRPSDGTIEMDGEVLSGPDYVRPPDRRNMSMIFQSYAIWPHMTVAENVAFGLTLRRLSAASIREKVERILDIVHLRQLAERYPAALSGGQQQRVALARAMVVEPGVLLLDEPLSNLDATLREEMRFEIRRLHDEFKITTVYVTHDQSEAMVTSDRIVVMNQGRVEQIDAPYALYNRPRTRFVAGFIGRTNFLEGTIKNGVIFLDGVSAEASLFPAAAGAQGSVVVSVRPQHIDLQKVRPESCDGRAWILEGQVTQRTYLGETWDYFIALAGSRLSVRASASPAVVFEVGDRVWMRIDPAHIVFLPQL